MSYRKIIVYYWNIINVYSLFSHEWWILLIKLMVGPTIYVRGGSTIYGTTGVTNNFPILPLSICLFVFFHHSINTCFPIRLFPFQPRPLETLLCVNVSRY